MYGPALQKALLITCYEVLYGDKGGVLNQWDPLEGEAQTLNEARNP